MNKKELWKISLQYRITTLIWRIVRVNGGQLLATNNSRKINFKIYRDIRIIWEKLIDLCMITKRALGDGRGVSIGDYFRLTRLGYNLCKYIGLYDDFLKWLEDKQL